MQLVT